jgi:hypothetical protein
LNATKIIRWILGELGMNCSSDIYKSWNKTDLVYHWEPINNPNYKILNCPYINNIFENKNYKDRNNTCYSIRKGYRIHKNIIFNHNSDSICIDRMNLKQIVECFNKCKYFYCYDPYTFFISYSILCGCIPIVYPIENKTKEEYINNTIIKNIKPYAIAYGNTYDEIKFAEINLNESANQIKNLNMLNLNNIHKFLEDIYNYYNDINLDLLPTVQNNYYN